MTDLSLTDAIRHFVTILTVEKGFSQHTARAYQQDLADFHQVCQELLGGDAKENPAALPVSQPDAWMVRRYLGVLHQRRLQRSSLGRKLAALRSFFRYAVRQGWRSDNPGELIPTPKQNKPLPEWLSVDDTFQVLDAFGGDSVRELRNRAMFELL